MTIRPVYKAYKISRRIAIKAKRFAQAESFRPDPVPTVTSKVRRAAYAALAILTLLSPLAAGEASARGGGHGGGHHRR